MCHGNEDWFKIWRGIDLSVQNLHEEFNEFWLQHWKISKTFTLMGCFWPKCIMFGVNKYRVVMFDGSEYGCKIWRKTDLCFQKYHEEFGKIFTRACSKVVELGLLLGPFVQSRKCMSLNWLVSSKLTWGIWRI